MTLMRFEEIIRQAFELDAEGAAEQYVLTALLEQDCSGKGFQVRANAVCGSGSSATVADIQVVDPDGDCSVYEVSSTSWRSKIPRAVAHLLNAQALHVLVAAHCPEGVSSRTVAQEVGKLPGVRVPASGLSVDVVDITTYCRVTALQFSPEQRTAVLRRAAELIRQFAPAKAHVATFLASGGRSPSEHG